MITKILLERNTTTQGLIELRQELTALPVVKLYKPTELQEMNLSENPAGETLVSFRIGQQIYETKNSLANFYINGVDMNAFNINQIADELSKLFLDTNTGGGGGGTTDNTTPPHLVYKALDNTFRDAPVTWDAPNSIMEKIISNGVDEFQELDEPEGKTLLLFAEAVVQKYFQLRKINGNAGNDFILAMGKGFQRITMLKDPVSTGFHVIDLGVIGADPPSINLGIRIDELLQNIQNEVITADGFNGVRTESNIYQHLVKLLMNEGTVSRVMLEIQALTGGADEDTSVSLGNTDSNQFIYIVDRVTSGAQKFIAIGRINDVNPSIVVDEVADGIYLKSNETIIGDVPGTGNGTRITVIDAFEQIKFESASGYFRFEGVNAFANDAAAILAGLVTGDIYKKTTAGVTALCIVP